MSTPSQEIAIDIAELQAFLLDTRIVVAAAALYYYEWFVTIEQEVSHIWTRKWTLSTWIFAVNRYATFCLVLLQMLPAPNKISCSSEIRLEQVCDILQLLSSSLFSGVRAFALCDRNIFVFLVVFGLSSVPVFANVVSFIKQTVLFAQAFPTNICEGILPFSPAVQTHCAHTALGLEISLTLLLLVSIATQIAVIIADVIVLVISWRSALGTVREASRLNIKTPLSMVLLRDGTFFFLALLVINVLLTLSTAVPAFAVIVPGNTLAIPLSSIIVSRFLLNLKQAVEGPNMTLDRSTVRFNSDILIGNLGESLNFGPEPEEAVPGLASDDSGSSCDRSQDIESQGTQLECQSTEIEGADAA